MSCQVSKLLLAVAIDTSKGASRAERPTLPYRPPSQSYSFTPPPSAVTPCAVCAAARCEGR